MVHTPKNPPVDGKCLCLVSFLSTHVNCRTVEILRNKRRQAPTWMFSVMRDSISELASTLRFTCISTVRFASIVVISQSNVKVQRAVSGSGFPILPSNVDIEY